MKVGRAKHCAWRGIYFDTNKGAQIARITLNPNSGINPIVTIAFPIGWYKSCDGRRFPKQKTVRIPMPRVRYRYKMGPIRLFFFRLFLKFWHNMDGRYGWGGPYRNK